MSKIITILFWYLSFNIALAQNKDTTAISLNDCIEAALHNNPEIKAAENEVTISNLSYKIAQSGKLPVIAAEASGGLSDQYKLGNNYRTGNGTISANQVIWQKGMLRSSISESSYIHESSKSSLQAQVQNVALAVKLVYINCLLQEQLYNSTLDNTAKARLFLEYARERYKIGAARKSDVLKAESDLAEAEYESSNYRNNRQQARNELAMLTGLSLNARLETIPEQLNTIVQHTSDSLFKQALTIYPELLAIESMGLSQQARIKQANAALYPQISIRGGYDWSYNPTIKEQKGWYTALSLRWNIYSGNERKHRIQTEQVRESIYQNQSTQVKNFLLKEISNTIIDLKEAVEQIKLSHQLITSTSENLEIAKAQYTAGTSSMLELTDARINNLKAKQKNIQAIAAFQLAKANLERLTNNTYDN